MFRRAGEEVPRRPTPIDADRPAVEAARQDPRAFDALYRKYVAQVYSFAAYELRDPHAAEDMTEQVFLSALAGLSRFEERAEGDGSTFRVWLFQICRNAISNERRRARRHPEAPLELALDVPASNDPLEEVAQREAARGAWRAVQRLPADRRRAVILRFVEEMTTSEIAAILGKSEGATRVLIHRALRAVASELGRSGRPS